jgi:ribonucleoside-triphosphate reductase
MGKPKTLEKISMSNNNYGMSNYMQFIAISRYARWLEDENRRENWGETVDRYMRNVVMPSLVRNTAWPDLKVDWIEGGQELYNEIEQAILGLEVCGSMRSLMTAGAAAERDNTCMYNCAYLAVDNVVAFDEAMFILLCGTGVGFSVERQSVSKLPDVPQVFNPSGDTIVVDDSKEGWAKALRKVVKTLYAGELPQWDVSKVRPAGAKLKTFGGRASGPAPLIDLFNFVTSIFKGAAGRKLSSIECHDIMCKIGEVVVVGGVRRSAMISLSNLSDDRMRHAKGGSWWETAGHRALANNSVAYTEKPDAMSFMREWVALAESGSGERGIFNRVASKVQAAKNGRREVYKGVSPSALVTWVDENGNRTGPPKEEWDFGTNPCSEIILRPNQFCNLTEVVVRATDSFDDLKRKVRLATILGTIQATYTKFPYLRKIWADNTEEERLLGVSLTGIMDHPALNNSTFGLNTMGDWMDTNLKDVLDKLKQIAIETNKEWAEKLGIPQSAAITCVKPSGTVSQLVDSASGIHTRYSPYYIRTVRGDNKDPITEFMIAQGIPNEPDVMKPDGTTVFSFPTKSPDGAIVTSDMSAIQQLEMWLTYQRHWCEHKPSVTISIRPDEWFDVGAFVYKHFDEMSGVSFLPFSEHTYQQAPYQEITKEAYDAALELMPKSIDWTKLSEYETEDHTKGSSTFACVGGTCEIVDLT